MLIGDRTPCVVIEDIKLTPEVVRPGERARVTWVALSHPCEGELQQIFIDSLGTRFDLGRRPTLLYEARQGVRGTFSREFSVPFGAASGQARYYAYLQRWRNSVQEQLWPMRETIGPLTIEVVRTEGQP